MGRNVAVPLFSTNPSRLKVGGKNKHSRKGKSSGIQGRETNSAICVHHSQVIEENRMEKNREPAV